MKKIFFLIITILLLTACNEITNAPKIKSEEMMMNYNKLSDGVIRNLDMTIVNAGVDESNYEIVREAFKRQYKDLEYDIIKSTQNKKRACMDIKITVYDYKDTFNKANEYINQNKEKFMTDNTIDKIKIEKYIYNQYLNTNKRKNYKIKVNLYKEKDKWIIMDLSDKDLEKIHGTFSY